MDKFREALSETFDHVIEIVKGPLKSPLEILLDEHLPFSNSIFFITPQTLSTTKSISINIMNNLASRTYNLVDYPIIMERIWDILQRRQFDPAIVCKALVLLKYLLINGAPQVYKDCRFMGRWQFLDILSSEYNRLEAEHYKYSQELDIGASVRKEANNICHYFRHFDDWNNARESAAKLNQELQARGLRFSYPLPERAQFDAIGEFKTSNVSMDSITDGIRPIPYTKYCRQNNYIDEPEDIEVVLKIPIVYGATIS